MGRLFGEGKKVKGWTREVIIIGKGGGTDKGVELRYVLVIEVDVPMYVAICGHM